MPKNVKIIRKDDNKYVYYVAGTEYKKIKNIISTRELILVK
ncbi:MULTISPECIES: hypothetical protein [unclassified Mycoplasma]